METYGKAANSQFIVSQNSQSNPTEAMAAGNTIWIDYKSKGVFRVRVANYWGDSGEHWIGNGKELLYFDGSTYHLYNNNQTMHLAHT